MNFINIAGYKNNIQESLAFLYTNNEQDEKATVKIVSFVVNEISRN